jgi:hypothetical protein
VAVDSAPQADSIPANNTVTIDSAAPLFHFAKRVTVTLLSLVVIIWDQVSGIMGQS